MDSQIINGGKFKMANNFVSEANATDLMNAINRKKDTRPDTITWDEWIALTDEQREGTHYIITNVPASFSSKDAVFALRNVTLEFTNKTAVITDARVTSDAYLFTFFYNEAVAQAAGIDCTWGNGTITFTVEENPTSDITLDILAILPALAPGGSGFDVIDTISTIESLVANTRTDLVEKSVSGKVFVTATFDFSTTSGTQYVKLYVDGAEYAGNYRPAIDGMLTLTAICQPISSIKVSVGSTQGETNRNFKCTIFKSNG